MGANETAAFTHAITDCAPLGYSLYAFPSTREGTWSALKTRRPTALPTPPAPESRQIGPPLRLGCVAALVAGRETSEGI
jgi:hypothetical protein